MPPVIFPPKLCDGDTIGIVAPGRTPDAAWIKHAVDVFTARGFRVVVHPQVSWRAGQLAGRAEERAAALHDFARDQNIRAIVANGGTGTYETLEHLDIAMMVAHPKIWVGFSDFTTLLNVLAHAGLVVFHGPMTWNMQPHFSPHNVDDMLAMLRGKVQHLHLPCHSVHDGRATGALAGGNVVTLANLLGTRWQPDFSGNIVLLEDVEEILYRLDA
ncbi:MAG: LD-carboxypeptidase, partial [Alphaproteobacteria bacterium]|nr:LD-carboxypeptidase [Alphaproteobacteria bacterium]